MCGGTFSVQWSARPGGGLSPRVRGNPGGLVAAGPAGRSIPACAGEPIQGLAGPELEAVYPRVCGGTGDIDYGKLGAQGLSPRVRGNPHPGSPGTQPEGSIPACAGEPHRYRHRHQLVEGLSPRVRGNPHDSETNRFRERSIPACAGEPREDYGPTEVFRVYPRVCGGTPWRFDSDPCYLIRQGNNAAPVGGTIPPACPPCPALFVATFGLRRRVIRLLNCGVRSACRYSGSFSVSSGHPGMSAAATAQTARAACRKDLKLGSATGFTPCASSELFRSCNGRRTLS